MQVLTFRCSMDPGGDPSSWDNRVLKLGISRGSILTCGMRMCMHVRVWDLIQISYLLGVSFVFVNTTCDTGSSHVRNRLLCQSLSV